MRKYSSLDLRLHVVAICLEPALTLSRMIALPLDELQELVATGYYREARRRRMSHRAIAKRFGKSLRTIAGLSKRAGEQHTLLASSEAIEQQRRVLELLAEDGTSDAHSLAERVPPSDVPLEVTLATLREADFIEVDDDGSVRLSTAHVPLVGDDVDRRLDGVRQLLGALTQVVYARFFSGQTDTNAFARVLTFKADQGEFDDAQAVYESLKQAAIDTDQRSGEDGKTVSVALCFSARPEDHHWRDRSTG